VSRVVLDTDVASRSFKRLLSPGLLAELIGTEPAITFVTQGELTKWAVRRQWGTVRQQRMARWLSRIPVLHSSDDIAAVGGEIAASAERRGRPRPQELGLICEPVSGFEPLTCRLQAGWPVAPSVLAAQTGRPCALRAPDCPGYPGCSFHDSFHGRLA